MKKISVLICLLTASVVFAQNNFVKIEAKILNRNSDSLMLIKGNKKIKVLKISKDEIFSDTLNAKTGMYQLYDGSEVTSVFLKNGYDLNIKLDAKEFDETIVYSGKGAEENNFIAKHALAEEQFDYNKLLQAESLEKFKELLKEKSNNDLGKLKKTKLDPDFVTAFKQNIEENENGITMYFTEMFALKELNNKPSPGFDYENHKGGKTKLEDLRGKYVYIDVWATWCGPCRAEIPHLKKLEELFHGKNIEFVSISIDSKKDYEKWKKFVTDKELGGIQLYADNDWNSQFVKDYNITGIPRFILVDPKGNIVNANEDRPSSPVIAKKLGDLVK